VDAANAKAGSRFDEYEALRIVANDWQGIFQMAMQVDAQVDRRTDTMPAADPVQTVLDATLANESAHTSGRKPNRDADVPHADIGLRSMLETESQALLIMQFSENGTSIMLILDPIRLDPRSGSTIRLNPT